MDTDISIIVATRNRPKALHRMLTSLSVQTGSENFSWEAIVVDNGSRHPYAAIAQKLPHGIPLRALTEEAPGKSRALNRGMQVANGRLLVFTDDDVTFPSTWLQELRQAMVDFPDYQGLCGPITPVFPPDCPGWLRAHPERSFLFSSFQPELPRGYPVPRHLSPYGPNMAIRSSAVGNVRFRTDLGPGVTGRPSMSEDVEFVAQLRAAGCLFAYLPAAGVFHHLTRRHLQIESVYDRAFELGRSFIVTSVGPTLIHAFYGFASDSHDDTTLQRRFDRGAIINLYCGQIYQEIIERSQVSSSLTDGLRELQFKANRSLLSSLATAANRDGIFDSLGL
jgi:glycosyltransferase involved in cell wall biosynthesis